MRFEVAAGLEVHVGLSTDTKIFCPCTTKFGGQPNTQTCPVCLGLPGTLPVLNARVVELAIRTGLALGCEIIKNTRFDRKNYFYPDLPKAYQISQLHSPICRGGFLKLGSGERGKRVGIREIHMEEDTGKLIHDPAGDCTLIDFNRSGVPLLEIVTEPDFESADEVIAYLEKLRETLIFLGVSDCRMQEGSMRADINLSVRPLGSQALGVRTEMKNMSSFKAIHKAFQAESRRQIQILSGGGQVARETRRWDEDKDESFPMRLKEDARDYRHFPEPDLPAVCLSQRQIDEIAAKLPPLPEAIRKRYTQELGLPEHDARLLTSAPEWVSLFEETLGCCGLAKEVSNVIMVELMRLSSETGTPPENMSVDARKLARAIQLMHSGEINRTVGKEVLEKVFTHDIEPDEYIAENKLGMLSDAGEISSIVSRVISENKKSVQDYLSGKEKALKFLLGQVMRLSGGRANPKVAEEVLRQNLDN